MLDLKIKERAVQLRKSGKTYTEIQRELEKFISKGTLSNWFKSIELTDSQKNLIWQKILDRSELGRRKVGWNNHQKRLNRIANIQTRAEKEFYRFKNDPDFLAGLTLYLAEGTKKFERFQFMNSDPYLAKLMVNWITKFSPNEKITVRLYIHELYQNEEYEKYWSNFLNIPLESFLKSVVKKTKHETKKNPIYKGCARLEVSGSELFWKIMKWRDMLYQNL